MLEAISGWQGRRKQGCLEGGISNPLSPASIEVECKGSLAKVIV